jgi:hypothetical protein
MAKKAPAKRKPNAIEQAAPQLAALGKRMDAARKPPAKRKPRAKKVVEPAVVPLSEDAKAKVLEALWNNTHPPIPSWLMSGLKSLLLIAVGIAAGIWFAGGIDVSPDNKPEPTPAPVPEPVKSFRVIFVKESGQTLAGEQLAIPGAKEIREYLAVKTTQEGGQVGWREYDPQQQTANEQPTMKALWEAAKPSLLPAPCLVVEVNGKATVMPFPKTVAEAVETLKKAGGA